MLSCDTGILDYLQFRLSLGAIVVETSALRAVRGSASQISLIHMRTKHHSSCLCWSTEEVLPTSAGCCCRHKGACTVFLRYVRLRVGVSHVKLHLFPCEQFCVRLRFLGLTFGPRWIILNHFAQVLRPVNFGIATIRISLVSSSVVQNHLLDQHVFLSSCVTGRGFNRHPSVDRIFGHSSTVTSGLMGLWAQLQPSLK